MKYLMLALLLTGCNEYPVTVTKAVQIYACEDKTSEMRAQFTVDCIKASNPTSEDYVEWLELCSDMAQRTYCKVTTKMTTLRKDCPSCEYLIVGEDK